MSVPPRTGVYMNGLAHQNPRHGQLSLRLKTKAVVMPAGSSYTFSDHTLTLYFDPLLVLSSPGNALAWFSAVLSGVNPVPAAVAAAELMAQYALRRVTAGGCVRFGIFLSAFLETVYDIPPPVSAVRAAVDGLDEMLPHQMYRNSENIRGPTVGSGLSEDEVAALEKHKFAGKEEEEAPSCSLCLEEYKEGDIITPLSSSCSHEFHNECISKWLRMKRTCPLCRSPVTGGRQAVRLSKIEREMVMVMPETLGRRKTSQEQHFNVSPETLGRTFTVSATNSA